MSALENKGLEDLWDVMEEYLDVLKVSVCDGLHDYKF